MKTDAKSNAVEVDAPTDKADIDAAYEGALIVLNTKPEPEKPRKDPEQENKDYYQSFRTRFVWFILLAMELKAKGASFEKGTSVLDII